MLSLPSSWSKSLAAISAVILSAVLLQWIDIASPSIADLRVGSIEMATLTSPDMAQARQATYVRRSEPLRLDGNIVAARLTFDIKDPATADLALFIRRVRDNYAVYVNGQLASPVIGTISTTPTYEGAQPRLTRLLPSLLVPGRNTIHIICARNLTTPYLREVYFGPAARLEPAFHHTLFVMRDIAQFAVVASAMVILFALAISSIIRKPTLVLTIATMLAFFILRQLHTLWLGVAWSQQFRDAYLLISATAVWTSCAAMVCEWTLGPARIRNAFYAFGVTASALTALLMAILPIPLAIDVTAAIESLVELVTFSFMSLRLLRFYAASQDPVAIEIFSAIVCLVMAIASIVTQTGVLPGVSDFLSIQGDAFVQFGALSIIAFIASGLARQGIGIYQLAALNNETLARKVEAKERELANQHAAMRAQDRERTLAAERGRIMSDVHDGIGSQLLGLLIQAKAAQTSPEKLVDGLQAALDDLYLVVDSLDTVEGSLVTALGTFRTRIEPKCLAAGVELAWDMGGTTTEHETSPTIVLQICRILQEAVSNAIRHGHATRLSLKLSRNEQTLTLILTDNGKGFDPATVTGKGRGLANMRKRAISIGGHLDMKGTPAGTMVELTLPA